MVRVAINGFGRIGRNFLRCWVGRENSNIEVVGINDTSTPANNAILLKYDSMLGICDADIQADSWISASQIPNIESYLSLSLIHI